MSYVEDLSGITTPSLTDLLYIYQNGSDYKITNKQLLDLIKTNTVIPLTQAEYDALTSAEQNNGSIYIITDRTITAADVEYSSGVSVADKLDDVDDKVDSVIGFDSDVVTLNSQLTFDLATGYVLKIGKFVYLTLSVRSSGDISSGTIIGTIPSGFRPKVTQNYPMLLGTASNLNVFPSAVSISTSGEIRQGQSNQARNIYFSIIYEHE